VVWVRSSAGNGGMLGRARVCTSCVGVARIIPAENSVPQCKASYPHESSTYKPRTYAHSRKCDSPVYSHTVQRTRQVHNTRQEKLYGISLTALHCTVRYSSHGPYPSTTPPSTRVLSLRLLTTVCETLSRLYSHTTGLYILSASSSQ
jgi:hypothetical protein